MKEMFSDSHWEKIREFAKERVSMNDSFHDMEHALRTADMAILLSVSEHGDRQICWASAMLHDICKKEPGDHAAEGAKQAKKFLLEIGVDDSFAERVRDAIQFHNKDFGDDAPLERKILWDSDKLFITTPEGFKTRLLLYWIMKKGRKDGIITAVGEYYFFKDRLHTKTARKKAERYAEEMEEYLKTLKS